MLTLLLSYGCTAALTALASLGLVQLGLLRSEAVLASSIAGFVLFPLLALWLFCLPRQRARDR